ncbi:MAG: 4Fe-4S binding protein [SAR324 cluster bacterium]|nr:4Fe-4S binding protein [SAR324 cluster bacterium]
MLAKINQGFGLGTPYIVPREGACILCRGLPCVLACPTGSLNHDISEGSEAEMGLAVVSRPETCLSIKGENDLVYELVNLSDSDQLADSEKLKKILLRLIGKLTPDELDQWKKKWAFDEISVNTIPQILAKLNKENISWLVDFAEGTLQAAQACQICLETCPIKEENPIVFETRQDAETDRDYVTPVVQKTCVGCGVCEMECPTPAPSITIMPRLKWKEGAA